MADYSAEASIGARIKAARRARGIKSIRELSEAVRGTSLTEAVLENIEAGRKPDLPISDLLNIARALRVPPAFLLAPLADPRGALDLPNLSEDFNSMSVEEFDAWLSGESAGAYRSSSPEERNDMAELDAFRELQRLKRELQRERVTGGLDKPASARLEYLERQTFELTEFLRAAGWVIEAPGSR